MDLRKYIRNESQIEKAKQLAIRGLLNYQPWIFSEDFETGVGMEWMNGEYAGLVYYPDIDQGLLERSPELRRLIINPEEHEKFHKCNSLLRRLYDGIVDELCTKAGDISKLSFLDVGCNTGYFPQSFALRGARESVGCDREKNFAETFDLLNDILGTRAVFYDSFYNPKTREIVGIKQYDVVIFMAVLCHLNEPLNHLKCLGALARKGLNVWTLVNNDTGYTMHYGDPKGDYKEDEFSLCFDNEISISEGLLRRSLELMGFNHIYEFPANDSALPSFSWGEFRLRGFWAMR
jgi:SAM-dependent methyltransferase